MQDRTRWKMIIKQTPYENIWRFPKSWRNTRIKSSILCRKIHIRIHPDPWLKGPTGFLKMGYTLKIAGAIVQQEQMESRYLMLHDMYLANRG